MDEVTNVVIDSGYSGVELVLAVIGVGGVIRLGWVASKMVIRASKVLDAMDSGIQRC